MTLLLTLMDRSLDRFARWTYQPYHQALSQLLARRSHLRIVVVGANDGKINDPVYGFVDQHIHQTEMVLIEPQSDLLKPLAQHYSAHPEVKIIEGAVGTPGCLELHTVDPDIWPLTQPFYAKRWPTYRAPSGIASTERDRVVKWMGRYVDNPNEHVFTRQVTAKPLLDWFRDHALSHSMDVLQVDTEGVDDQVIYQSSLEITQPAVIYFESKNLERARLIRLKRYLTELGYGLRRIFGNTLATRDLG